MVNYVYSMKIFAHRGWSSGENENTIFAFKRAIEAGLSGVEFDIRYGPNGKTIVLSHNLTVNLLSLTLADACKFLQSTNLELLIEFKEYSNDLYAQTVMTLEQYGLSERATLFAFADVAKYFPWDNRGSTMLGIVAPYPQEIKKYIDIYNPNMVLMGWGNTIERFLFKLVWQTFSLKRIFKKYYKVQFIIGVAYREEDKRWLSMQAGLYGMTADMPLL